MFVTEIWDISMTVQYSANISIPEFKVEVQLCFGIAILS